jgi:uncharacterized membrane protein (DUF4010 family)
MFEQTEYTVFWKFAQALGIGFLIGSQRESASDEKAAGIRDFIIYSMLGAIAGLLAEMWLTIAALFAVVTILVVYRLQHPERSGITTEGAAVATYWLAYLTQGAHAHLALVLAIVIVALLSAKRPLHHFVKETITEREYNDTLKFLTIVVIIYPLLPAGAYGPYEFFSPRQVWLFVIFVSTVSYVGYFFTKFLGPERGLIFTGLLGGLASTTAATTAFAKSARETPELVVTYGRAAVVANAIQFPRIAVILLVINPVFARVAVFPLLMMSLAGLLLSILLAKFKVEDPSARHEQIPLKNPFSLWPALKFGVLFTIVMLFSKFGVTTFGNRGILLTSFLGGIVDVDAIAISVGDLVASRQDISYAQGLQALVLALAANAVLKTVIAFTGGSRAFAWRLLAAFVLMFSVGGGIVGLGINF